MTTSTVGSRHDLKAFSSAVSCDGLSVRIGPFDARIQAQVATVHDALYRLYSDYPLLDSARVHSFRAKIELVRRLRHWHRPLVRFSVDGVTPHEDMPADQALAVLEWGINLVIALRSHCFLILHSAVLERDGKVILLPAAPGHGKTTLCAALAHRGWRLLSDEFGLVRPGSLEFTPVPRPMALKNESIAVIRNFAPEAVLGPSIAGTRKGTVAHVKPPTEAVRRQVEPAAPRWIVFPRWEPNASQVFESLSRSEGFMMLAMNAFNYELLGEAGFVTASEVVRRSDCYRLLYSNLDEAVDCLTRLFESDAGAR